MKHADQYENVEFGLLNYQLNYSKNRIEGPLNYGKVSVMFFYTKYTIFVFEGEDLPLSFIKDDKKHLSFSVLPSKLKTVT